VYVIPPNVMLTIRDGTFLLAPRTREHPNTVDEFLLSLAREQADVACVILSGTGTDGTIGLRAIKESGGLALAQQNAEYDAIAHLGSRYLADHRAVSRLSFCWAYATFHLTRSRASRF
jgi:hypothetical protein